jgi:hypothetical protein
MELSITHPEKQESEIMIIVEERVIDFNEEHFSKFDRPRM